MPITEKQKLARQTNAKKAGEAKLKKKELNKYVIYDSDDDSGSDDYSDEENLVQDVIEKTPNLRGTIK